MKLNILVTSASRKVWLIKAFKNALQLARMQGNVISVDTDKLSAGLYVSDRHYLVPLASSRDFLKVISALCKKEKIRLLVPTRDGELLFFSEKRAYFKKTGVEVMVSGPEVIKTCNDKYMFHQFLVQNSIPTPKTFLARNCDFHSCRYPLILKPRYGSGGSAVVKVNNEQELRFFIRRQPDSIVQEFIEGKEYTIDVFADFNGKVITIIPRERIEIINGESYKARTVIDHQMADYAKSLTERIGALGHLTIQCIKNGKEISFFEMNPRFGGGAMLGIKAGGNTPLFLIKLMLGKTIRPRIGRYTPDLAMLRYTEDLFL